MEDFDFLDYYAIVAARQRMHKKPRNEPEKLMDELITKWYNEAAKWKADAENNATNQND